MNRVASLLAGLSLLGASAGCCCHHLHGAGACPPAMGPACAPACPSGACGVVQPGFVQPGMVQPGVVQPGFGDPGAPLVQPQGYYGTHNMQGTAPVTVAPVVTQTALVPLETLPTY